MSDQRRCPGTNGTKCNKFMSSVDRDSHKLCTSCRGRDCSPNNVCDICVDWDDVKWKFYLSRKKHKSPASVSSNFMPFSRVPSSAGSHSPRASTTPVSEFPATSPDFDSVRPGPSGSDQGFLGFNDLQVSQASGKPVSRRQPASSGSGGRHSGSSGHKSRSHKKKKSKRRRTRSRSRPLPLPLPPAPARLAPLSDIVGQL